MGSRWRCGGHVKSGTYFAFFAFFAPTGISHRLYGKDAMAGLLEKLRRMNQSDPMLVVEESSAEPEEEWLEPSGCEISEFSEKRSAPARRFTEIIDLPFPVGYGGLPAEEVEQAEANNDRLGITDPVERKLNVLSWMRCSYRDRGDTKMAQEMKEEYHLLSHTDPKIQDICGICEYQEQERDTEG